MSLSAVSGSLLNSLFCFIIGVQSFWLERLKDWAIGGTAVKGEMSAAAISLWKAHPVSSRLTHESQGHYTSAKNWVRSSFIGDKGDLTFTLLSHSLTGYQINVPAMKLILIARISLSFKYRKFSTFNLQVICPIIPLLKIKWQWVKF